MKDTSMCGFFPALITPFTADNHINEQCLTELMRNLIGQGATGFLVGGSSAECMLLTHEERARAFELAGRMKDQTKLMASVAAIGTDEAIDYAKRAQAAGCHALISTPPFYYKFGMAQIAAYFRDIRAAVDLPLYLYNFPGNTGVEIDLGHPDIRAMLTDGTIAGVKQTSLNLYQLERMRDMNPDLVLYGGYDEVYLGARMLGADGAIGSTFNFTLPLFVKIEQAYQQKDIAGAQALQTRANHIMQALVSCSLFPSIKHVLCAQGLDVGVCRRPFPALSVEQKRYIDQVVAENMGHA